MSVATRKVEGTDPKNRKLPGQLGGARADFVAALGRRISELSHALGALEGAPTSANEHGELLRRVATLLSSAKLLRFAALSRELEAARDRLERAGEVGGITAEDAAALRESLARMPELAWGHTPEGASIPPLGSIELTPSPTAAVTVDASAALVVDSEPAPARPASQAAGYPLTVLVIGTAKLTDALTAECDADGPSLDVEASETTAAALDLARVLAPDLLIVDVDLPAARDLIEDLLGDPLTEAIPVIAVGSFAKPEEAAPIVAMGVARALAKPASPSSLRRACAEVVATFVRRESPHPPIGKVSLDELGARLGEEIRRGLCDDVIAKSRSAEVDLGVGSEALAAVWAAVARVRDIVTVRSAGQVRFVSTGPEGALPLASLSEPEASKRALVPTEGRGALAPSLRNVSILVADDDAAVTWFLAGILREAGATVREAHDGARALELAYETPPDLVISDVVMPRLDGFALCRALKRDVVLRDTPVILLSWKEDLLQRVRDLGGGADGYLRKEASAAVIVHRVREVLRSRSAIAERLHSAGEVRGRLDGLTIRTLLDLACTHRPTSTVTVRDASFLYDVELRDGRPAKATRTASDGSFQTGPRVLGSLLGVGTGRFIVSESSSTLALRADLEGTLSEQLLPAIAKARASQRLLSGEALLRVERVVIDDEVLSGYLAATPEPARDLLLSLGLGQSPRGLITSSEVSARLIEDVLCDAAARGAIVSVETAQGKDVLAAAIAHETDTLRGLRPARVAPPPVAPASPAEPVEAPTDTSSEASAMFEDGDDDELPSSGEGLILGTVEGELSPSAPIAEDESRRRPTLTPPASITLGSLVPPPVVALPPAARTPSPMPARVSPLPTRVRSCATPEPPRNYLRPSAYAPMPPPPAAPQRNHAATWILLAVAGVAFAVAARWARMPHAPVEPAAAAITAPASPALAAAAQPSAAPSAEPNPDAPVEEVALRPDDKVPSGQGMLEVVVGKNDSVAIDGRVIGEGPVVKLPLAPRAEPYEVKVKIGDQERAQKVSVKEGRLTKIRFAAPWTR